MLKVGIVGLKNSEKYIKALQHLDSYQFVGLYDPAFQVDLNLFHKIERGVLDFKELVINCDIVIFSADDKVFFPLIQEVISHSKSVFLDSFNKYNYDQLKLLSKLAFEANCIVQVLHTQLFHAIYKAFEQTNPHPFIINSEVNISRPENLLFELRKEVGYLLHLVKSSIRKVKVNIASTCSQIPDLYTIVIDFNNGCNCRLVLSSLNMPDCCTKRIIGINAHYELDFSRPCYTFYEDGTKLYKEFFPIENNTELLISRQLEELYLKIISDNVFCDSLNIEIETCKVLEQVTDKLKICMAIV